MAGDGLGTRGAPCLLEVRAWSKAGNFRRRTTSSCFESHAFYTFSVAKKLKRSSLVSQDTIVRFLQTAAQAVGWGDFKEGLEILERARSLAPGNPDILLQLGRIHGLRFDYAVAGEYFEKAVHFTNHKTLALSKAGAYAYEFYNLELSERYMRRATEQKDATAETWMRLAGFLESARKVSESAQCIEQALRLDPSFPDIPLVRAQLERHAGHWEEAEKLFRSILPTSNPRLRLQCLYELSAVLDRQGRYDEAMAALIEAKAPFQDQAGMFRLKRETRYRTRRKVVAGMSGALLQRWSGAGSQLQPARRLALLSGHPRSGTTLLEQVLDSHPDIVAAEEATIFHQEVCVPLAKTRPPDADSADPSAFQLKLEALEAAPVELLRRLRENYFRSMEQCVGQPLAGRLVVDKNPMFSLLISGFPRVFPEAKLLVALRDPRDVCLSCFFQFLHPNIDTWHSAYINLSDIVEHYVEEMTLWRTLAPLMPGQYLEVRYEDMVEDLESVARKTLEFLDVPWDPGVMRFYEQAGQKAMRHPNYENVSKPVYNRARQRWRHYEKYFQPYLEKLEPFVKAFGYD
jgi:tetratricopeptide (TPR) repeat protein